MLYALRTFKHLVLNIRYTVEPFILLFKCPGFLASLGRPVDDVRALDLYLGCRNIVFV